VKMPAPRAAQADRGQGGPHRRNTGMIEIGNDPSDVALFASDMHLGEHDPATAAHFLGAFDRVAPAATHLFLLGDLFEAWVGDDQTDAIADAFIARLRSLSDRGKQLFVVRGNRDFLLDVPLPEAVHVVPFSQRSGARMLDDPHPVRLFGCTVLLAHGDALCTDDVEYQQARTLARSAEWQREFLARPLEERLAIASRLRDDSRRTQAERALEGKAPGDVDVEAVEQALRDAHAQVLIHGHTHRPALHRHEVDGVERQRWVLSDWQEPQDSRPARGTFVRVDRGGWRLVS